MRLLPILAAAVLAGCSPSGPVEPNSHYAALTLQARLYDAPQGDGLSITLGLNPVPYCPETFWIGGVHNGAFQIPFGAGATARFSTPFDPTADTLAVTAASWGTPVELCHSDMVPLVRFFSPRIYFVEGGGPQPYDYRAWGATGLTVVYAPDPTMFSPFGPAGVTLALPAGYSLLSQTCGPGDPPWNLQVLSLDQPIDFRPLPGRWSDPVDPEQDQGALLDGCHGSVPATALGVRVSSARATSVAWSPAGDALYYLAAQAADSGDPSPHLWVAAPVDGLATPRDQGMVPAAFRLQAVQTGALYLVSTDPTMSSANMIQVDLDPAGPAHLDALSIPATGSASPSGRWIAYADTLIGAGRLMVQDTTDGSTRAVQDLGPTSWSWTPDSRLAFSAQRPDGQAVLTVIDPGGGTSEFAYAGLDAPYWSASGPVDLLSPDNWNLAVSMGRLGLAMEVGGSGLSSGAAFGVEVENAVAGTRLTALPVSAGLVVDQRGAIAEGIDESRRDVNVPGVTIVQTRRCQGLFETLCQFDLHRISLPDASSSTLGTAHGVLSVVLSPDGRALAISAPDGLYVKSVAGGF